MYGCRPHHEVQHVEHGIIFIDATVGDDINAECREQPLRLLIGAVSFLPVAYDSHEFIHRIGRSECHP
jgi:hypothetical protein